MIMEIKICTLSGALVFCVFSVAPVDHEGNSVTCEVCKYAMSYLEDMLKENKTEVRLSLVFNSPFNHVAGFRVFHIKIFKQFRRRSEGS